MTISFFVYLAEGFLLFSIKYSKEVKMPGFDRTGPSGAGAKTGRGLGRCTGYIREEYPRENRVSNVSEEYPVRLRKRLRDFSCRFFDRDVVPGAGIGRGRGIYRRSRW